MSELKTCTCGGEPGLKERKREDGMVLHWCKCKDCGFSGRSAFNVEYAEENWNKAEKCMKCGKLGILHDPWVAPHCTACGDGHDPDEHGYG